MIHAKVSKIFIARNRDKIIYKEKLFQKCYPTSNIFGGLRQEKSGALLPASAFP
jgi:hypothetical protein